MINLTTLINTRIRAKLKARSEAKATKGRAISAAAKADPVVYAREVFGLTVWSKQRDLLRSVRDHARTTVRSGHKVSKSTSAAVVGWWFTSDPDARPSARAIVTAPTARQVREVIWREVKALHARATRRGYSLPVPGNNPGTGVRYGDGRELIGFTIDDGHPEAIAGFSGANLLFVLDEASGVGDAVFEALDGNAAAEGARFLLISNPTRTSGAFYDSHQPRSDYHRLHIDSHDSPNVTGEATIPGLASPGWIAKMEAKYGRDSLFCAVRVRGEFPAGADDEVFGATLVREAMERAGDDDGELVLGLDVAGFGGDENCLAARRGRRVLPIITIEPGESIEVAGRALRAIRRLKRAPGERPQVRIDANGVGAGVFSALVSDGFEWDGERFTPRDEVEAIAVNTSESAFDDATYANLRAELHFVARDWLREGGSLPSDDLLDEELRAPRYSLDKHNRILVEPKLKIRARLGRSPDRSDAVLLAVVEIASGRRAPVPPPLPDDDSRSLAAFAAR